MSIAGHLARGRQGWRRISDDGGFYGCPTVCRVWGHPHSLTLHANTCFDSQKGNNLGKKKKQQYKIIICHIQYNSGVFM